MQKVHCKTFKNFFHYFFNVYYIYGPWEQWQSIVMSTCVCVCVCVFVQKHIHISRATHAIFTTFSVHVAYGHGSVLRQQGDEIRGEGVV